MGREAARRPVERSGENAVSLDTDRRAVRRRPGDTAWYEVNMLSMLVGEGPPTSVRLVFTPVTSDRR